MPRKASLLLILASSAQCSGGGTPPTNPRPDVVMFVIDDVADTDVDDVMNAGWLPNLEALAAQGVRFRRAYAHAKCDPTRDSLYFLRYLGLDRGDACDVPVPGLTHEPADYALPKMFAGQGYSTCLIGKHHTGSDRYVPWEVAPEAHGWGNTRAMNPVGPACNIPGVMQNVVNDGVVTQTSVDSTIRCRDAFLQWWAETPSPRFVAVNFGSAHAPFKYPPSSILPQGYPPCGLPCDNREEYEAEIAGVDFVIGQMLAVVPADAWVLFLADNGTPGFVSGEDPSVTVATRPNQDPMKVKLTCYEDGVRIPLIVKGPGVSPGHESQLLVQVGDIMPTLAGALGIQPPVAVQGKSFAPGLHGLSMPRDPVFVWNPPPRLDMAMIGQRWKLLTTPDGTEVLIDLLNDPQEVSPLPPVGPEADALRAARDALLAEGP